MVTLSALDGQSDGDRRPAEVRPFQASTWEPEDGAEEEDTLRGNNWMVASQGEEHVYICL